MIFGESLMNNQHYRCAVSYIISVLYFRLQQPVIVKMQPFNLYILCEPWEESMHLQLEPWSSGPASGCGFKYLFDHKDAFQNTNLLLGLYASSRKCSDVFPSRATEPQVWGAVLPSTDFPSTQDQQPVPQTDRHTLPKACSVFALKWNAFTSKEREQEGS